MWLLGVGETKAALCDICDGGRLSRGVYTPEYGPGLCAYADGGPTLGVEADAEVLGCGDCIPK